MVGKIDNQDTLAYSGLKKQHFLFLVMMSELNITSNDIKFCFVLQSSFSSLLLRLQKLDLILPLEFQCHHRPTLTVLFQNVACFYYSWADTMSILTKSHVSLVAQTFVLLFILHPANFGLLEIGILIQLDRKRQSVIQVSSAFPCISLLEKNAICCKLLVKFHHHWFAY